MSLGSLSPAQPCPSSPQHDMLSRARGLWVAVGTPMTPGHLLPGASLAQLPMEGSSVWEHTP